MNPDGDPVRDYIRAYMRANTREAVKQALVDAGHDSAHIDAVWEEESRAVAVEGARATLTGLGMSLFIVLGILGALGALLIGGLSGGGQVSMASSSKRTCTTAARICAR